MQWNRGQIRRVGKVQRAHHLTACSLTDGGHVAYAPLPSYSYLDAAKTWMPGTSPGITARYVSLKRL